jgi:hypothetical protein
VFDLSASDNFITPLVPISLPVLSEKEMKNEAAVAHLQEGVM